MRQDQRGRKGLLRLRGVPPLGPHGRVRGPRAGGRRRGARHARPSLPAHATSAPPTPIPTEPVLLVAARPRRSTRRRPADVRARGRHVRPAAGLRAQPDQARRLLRPARQRPPGGVGRDLAAVGRPAARTAPPATPTSRTSSSRSRRRAPRARAPAVTTSGSRPSRAPPARSSRARPARSRSCRTTSSSSRRSPRSAAAAAASASRRPRPQPATRRSRSSSARATARSGST